MHKNRQTESQTSYNYILRSGFLAGKSCGLALKRIFSFVSVTFISGDKSFDLGGMACPTEEFKSNTLRMYQLFCSFHPKDSLRKEKGIISGFAKVLKSYFPSYHDQTLFFVSETLTTIRLREMNYSIFKRKLKENQSHPYTTRGKNQIARLSS